MRAGTEENLGDLRVILFCDVITVGLRKFTPTVGREGLGYLGKMGMV